MKTYGTKDLEQALLSLNLSSGRPIMIHSALLALGRPEEINPKALPETLIGLFQKLFPCATLLVPTFTFQWCRGEPFVLETTPSRGMGTFSEAIRKHRGSKRSPHALQSIAALGPHAARYTQEQPPSAFDPEGAFDRFLHDNGQLLCLGATFEALSLVHWAEEAMKVPYRYWKRFTGPYKDKKGSGLRTFHLYARNEKLMPRVHLEPIARKLREKDQLRSIPFGHTALLSCNATEFADAALSLLHRDVNALIYETGGNL